MKIGRMISFGFVVVLDLTLVVAANACTNLLVTRGASVDGSVMITYTCDGEFHPHLTYLPAADHAAGETILLRGRDGVPRKIPQVPHTYAVVGYINEHQLAIGETTFSGRPELWNPAGLLSYPRLMSLALQRAKTAREAIDVMTTLVEKYGYCSTGESFSIADTKEAWILEMIGPGPKGDGAIWVARRVPDGCISAHANKARIGEIPLDDKENCRYSANVISFAERKGYYDPARKEPFRFNEAYCPSTPKNRRYASARVWSLFRRAAPSLGLASDYHRGKDGAKPYPLWIKPDKKLGVADVFALMRDHYEGTDFDMTRGVDAGPFGMPDRWRPITWRANGNEYAWERPISTQQTGFSFVSQSRDRLPDPIGGVLWYGLDNTYTTCYVPLYCGIDAVPESFQSGRINRFSWDSGWWVFNFVANYANLRYSAMLPEIQAVQRRLEGQFLALQPAIEKVAVELRHQDADLATRFLTDYSVSHGDSVVKRWRALGEHLVQKFNDGYIQDTNGRPHETGYPEAWLQRVLKERPRQFELQRNDTEKPESKD